MLGVTYIRPKLHPKPLLHVEPEIFVTVIAWFIEPHVPVQPVVPLGASEPPVIAPAVTLHAL
jgi:hypothetical protein